MENKQMDLLAPVLKTASVTPMMRQYLSIKEGYAEHLLFYRMGDFYELFFEDAKVAAAILDIALTKRGKHQDVDIPMCGVPVHASEAYLAKLISHGQKVAVCEQMETPKEARKRGSQAVVRRDVVRIITPGTLLESNLLDARSHNNLCAIAIEGEELAIAIADISTGYFEVCSSRLSSLDADLARINPTELLISEKSMGTQRVYTALGEYIKFSTVRSNLAFELNRSQQRLLTFFKLATLSGIGEFSKLEIGASGALLEYLEYTQKASLPRLAKPRKIMQSNFMQISGATRRNLELDYDVRGERHNSLRYVMDKTITACGGRLLSSYLAAPLSDSAAVNRRLDNVDCLFSNEPCRVDLRSRLKAFPDVERSLSRIFSRAGSPSDLAMIRDGINASHEIYHMLNSHKAALIPALQALLPDLAQAGDIHQALSEALKPEVIHNTKDGYSIREGFNQQLDNLRDANSLAQKRIAELQQQYRLETEIATLKISRNNIIGYYIELTAAQAKKVLPAHFTHKQTLGTAVRYVTADLLQVEGELTNSASLALELEREIFYTLCTKVAEQADIIKILAAAVAKLDVFSALAQLAFDNDYVKPIVDESCIFHIRDGRHPMVERSNAGRFTPNSCTLDDNHNIWLMTGPNMAGKSTFLRQNALLAIMAHIGSFVPASYAHIGAIDKLFSRVGAGDDISRGQSTFMVEMVETANVINNATARSFVILDEIGRGTSTYDGLAIAKAVIEHISQKIGCRTLFATHYHELTELEQVLPSMACYTLAVQDNSGTISFLHQVIPGKAERSYGIHVASLAGMPTTVIGRAINILQELEESDSIPTGVGNSIRGQIADCTAHEDAYGAHNDNQQVVQMLRQAEPEALSPREALELIYKIKEMMK